MFEIKLIQIDSFEIELFRLDTFDYFTESVEGNFGLRSNLIFYSGRKNLTKKGADKFFSFVCRYMPKVAFFIAV